MAWLGFRVSVALSVMTGAPTLLGCGGGTQSGFATMGMPGIPSMARIAANIVLAEVEIDHHRGPPFVIDTGSPFTLFDPSDYPGASFGSSAQLKIDVGFGQFTVDDVPALQIPLVANGVDLPPIVGGNLLRQFPTEVDYRGMKLRLGAGAPATGVEEPGGSVSFALRGGGGANVNGTIILFPATRVVVTADFEGQPHTLILDTGASEVAVRSSVYETLVGDGRAQLSGLPISTAMGLTSAQVTRAKTITVAGQTVINPAVMTVGDELLDSLEGEIHIPVDGLLGGSFLRAFLVTIDYPNKTLGLQRYTPPVAMVDEFKRVGFELGPGMGSHRYAVARVYPGTDAARQQIAVGDELVSVDGQSLDALDGIAADLLLDGEVGTSKQVGFGVTSTAVNANDSMTSAVD